MSPDLRTGNEGGRTATARPSPGDLAARLTPARRPAAGDVLAFVFTRVRPAGRTLPTAHRGEDLPEAWLIAEWPPGSPEPIKYWLSNLPTSTAKRTLIRWAKLRWRIEHDYREVKTGLGLDHYEGRTSQGWHHHVTLVSAAHIFLTLQRLDPKTPAPQ